LQALFKIGGPYRFPSITVHSLVSDGLSTIHIQPHQKFYIEYEEVAIRRSFPKVNIILDYKGEVFLVPDFHVTGLKSPAFEFNGRMTGVSNLTITENRLLRLGKNASTALMKRGNYTETPVEGELTYGVLVLEADSKVIFENKVDLEADTLHMRKNTLLTGSSVAIVSAEVIIEGGANITTSLRGPAAGAGIMPGVSTQDGVGSGAGHGGQGGPSIYVNGSEGYGSYVSPSHPGSGGGGPFGGQGGSTIKVTCSVVYCVLF